ncbi:hypothetical protein LCGC14_2239690 [marine sediment metagenome]|uniref:Uncharacterized protein n=1 Tax=marine sediment metagenome TaxID=412755 RepID=A0A0F9DTE1_9ZZZZ
MAELRLLRRTLCDYAAIAEETRVRRGKLCHSPIFGWVVQSDEVAHVACVETSLPPVEDGEELRLSTDTPKYWEIWG